MYLSSFAYYCIIIKDRYDKKSFSDNGWWGWKPFLADEYT